MAEHSKQEEDIESRCEGDKVEAKAVVGFPCNTGIAIEPPSRAHQSGCRCPSCPSGNCVGEAREHVCPALGRRSRELWGRLE